MKRNCSLFNQQVRVEDLIKKILLAGLLFASATSGSPAQLNLIPLPAKVEQGGGQFALDEKTAVVADDLFTNEAALIVAEWHLGSRNDEVQNRILLTTNDAAGLDGDAYRMEVNEQGVTIHALSSAGAFYGCQTLRQLAGPGAPEIPFVKIEDAPRYAWRGLMLDVSRHFFDKPAILQLLDWMAEYKLNRLHLHLTDDPGWRLEMQKYPELTRTGARGNYSDTNAPAQFFTRAEMREIIEYAARRHIVVVPEIDMPGHAGAAIRTYPRLDGGAHTFNPARPETYEFLESALRDVMELFPSPWIHLGGDEVNRSAWDKNVEVRKKIRAEGLSGSQALENEFVDRMVRFIQQQGRIPLGWDEIVAAKPSPGTVIFWWRHDKPEMLVQALAEGYPVVLTPRSPCYFDYPQDKSYPQIGWKLINTPEAVYRGPAVPAGIPPAQLAQILGVEGCLWTEHIDALPYLEFMAMPRMAALAEMAWTPDQHRDFVDFKVRLKPHLDEYQQQGIHFYDETNAEGSLREARQSPASAPKLSLSEH